MENLPTYTFKVKEGGTDTGMLGISIVDDPAIMSDFVTFSADKMKPQFISLETESGEYKKELLGAALRPDLPILRKDEAGNFYYGIFEKDTIEIIRNKFHKQKHTSEVNLQHDQNMKVDAYLIESYIIQTEEQLTATKGLGLEDIELGAWVVRYKVESEEVFNRALEGDFNGFSIEVLLQRELQELNKNNFNEKTSIMSKLNKLIDKFKSAIEEFEDNQEEVTPTPETKEGFEDVTVAESDVVLRYSEVGQPVMEVTVDEAGEETEVAATEGEFILSDGRTLVVDADGNLAEIREAEGDGEAPAADPAEGELKAEEKLNTEKQELEGEEDTSTTETGSDLNKKLSELIPTSSDGTYQLEVYVSDGKISFGTLYAWTYSDLKLEKVTEEYEELKTEKENLNKEVEKLQAEMEKPIAKPVFTEFKGEKNNKEKQEFKNNLDYTLHRLGLDH